MTEYRVGLLLGLTIGILMATSVTSVFLYKNTMIEYCEGNVQALVVLGNQQQGTLDNKHQGILYLHCKGKIYESPLNVSSEARQSQQISYSGGM